MKKRYPRLIAAFVLILLLCVWLYNADNLCIGRIEDRTDDQWSHMHLFMNDEITVDFPIEKPGQPCYFQWESGRGSFVAVITDASGNVVFGTSSEGNGSELFSADSDLTLRIRAKGHGGVFALTRRDDPSLLSGDSADKSRLLGEGNHTGGNLVRTYECQKVDGKYVNFYVHNTGACSVTININGSYARTIEPGSAGHVRAPISTTILSQSMTLECVSADGSDMDIYWKAAQRDGSGS